MLSARAPLACSLFVDLFPESVERHDSTFPPSQHEDSLACRAISESRTRSDSLLDPENALSVEEEGDSVFLASAGVDVVSSRAVEGEPAAAPDDLAVLEDAATRLALLPIDADDEAVRAAGRALGVDAADDNDDDDEGLKNSVMDELRWAIGRGCAGGALAVLLFISSSVSPEHTTRKSVRGRCASRDAWFSRPNDRCSSEQLASISDGEETLTQPFARLPYDNRCRQEGEVIACK